MSGPTPADERVQAYLDGRMAAEEREVFERELVDDSELRDQLDTLRWIDEAARGALASEAPAGLEQSLGQLLEREEAGSGASNVKGRSSSLPYWAAAIAALLIVAAGAWWALRFTPVETPDVASATPSAPADIRLSVARDVHDYVEGRLSLDRLTTDVVAMEQYFAENGIDFETRVFDLAMMELQLAGGLKHELHGHESAAFVYHGPEDLRVLCQMYRGSEDELPPGADIREHNGITFYSYEIDCVSMSFWREGDVICVLAAMGDLERVVGLAFAKAMKV